MRRGAEDRQICRSSLVGAVAAFVVGAVLIGEAATAPTAGWRLTLVITGAVVIMAGAAEILWGGRRG
jgi:type IV secretory pathway VirB2 component (pilin)